MKTLKKTLCLILALAMVLSFGAMSASAKLAYTDKADIQVAEANDDMFAEAIDTLGIIGVMEGYPDNTFMPTKAVTRAEAAKVIAYLATGDADRADALKAPADPFDDVSKDHWAAGYIAYCVQIGVINGMGDGTFAPDAEVTGLQFAKMLLSVLGYGVNGEYTGANWGINAAKDGLTYGLFDDYEQGASNTAATREEIALYAFNALFLYKVSYSTLLGDYINMIGDSEWGDGYYGWVIGNAGEGNMEGTLAEDFGLWYEEEYGKNDTDEFYRDLGHRWGVKVGTKKVYTDWYDADKYLIATYTTKVTMGDLYEVLDKKNRTANAVVYINGHDEEEVTLAASKGSDTQLKVDGNNVTGNGVETYVYEYGKDQVKICIINWYPAKVTRVVGETKTQDAYAKVKVVDTTFTYETEDLEKDDELLVTISHKDVDDGEIIDIAEPTKANAKITKYAASKPTIDGTTYSIAFNDQAKDAWGGIDGADVVKSYVNGKYYDYYVDSYGYLVGIKGAKAAEANIVYAADFGYKTDTSKDLYDEQYATAAVYGADAEKQIVKLDIENWLWLIDSLIDEEEILEWIGDLEIDAPDFDGNVATMEGLRYVTHFGYYLNDETNILSWLVNYEDMWIDITPSVIAPLIPYGLYEMTEVDDDGYVQLIPVQVAAELNGNKYDGLFYGQNEDDRHNIEAFSSKVVKNISALRYDMDGDDIFADDDTVFYYVTNPDAYGTKNWVLTVYTGIGNVKTISQQAIYESYENGFTQNGFLEMPLWYGLNSYYAKDQVATAALCFFDVDNLGAEVYFYDDKDVAKEEVADDEFVVRYETLYLAGEKVDAIEYAFTKASKADDAIEDLADALEARDVQGKFRGWVRTDDKNLAAATENGAYIDGDMLYLDEVKFDMMKNNTLYFIEEDGEWLYNYGWFDASTNKGLYVPEDVKVIDLRKADVKIESRQDLKDFFAGELDKEEDEGNMIKAYVSFNTENYTVETLFITEVEYFE